MTGERVCVRTHEVGSTPIKFSSSYTLDIVAGRFHHDRSSGFIDVKTTGEGGLFTALPLDTALARLRDEGDLEGDGSWDNSFIVRVERAGRFDAEPDHSLQYCQELIEDTPDQPPSLGQLKEFLCQPPRAKLPILADTLHHVPPELRHHFRPAVGALALAFSNCITPSPTASVLAGSSEHITLVREDICVVAPLLALDQASYPEQLGLQLERDKGDSSSLLTIKSASGASMRPDGALRHSDGRRMMTKWEDKDGKHKVADAIEDVRKKTQVWTKLYYGDISSFPCFAAAGASIQFVAVDPGLQVTTISPIFDTNQLAMRVRLLLCDVQFYKLLRVQAMRYPDMVLPLCKDLVAETPVPGVGTIKRTLYFCSDRAEARKRIEPWSMMETAASVRFQDIAHLYAATARLPGLVHAVQGPSLTDDKYTVTLAPLGRQGEHEKFETEEDVRRMAHGLLHGLAAIHGVQAPHAPSGFVYRDLRKENTACSPDTPRRWFLLDLECCAQANQPGIGVRTGAEAGVLVDGCFTAASDIFLLGKLLANHSDLVTSEKGQHFMAVVCVPAQEQPHKAFELLGHPWLACMGNSCVVAGARFGERA